MQCVFNQFWKKNYFIHFNIGSYFKVKPIENGLKIKKNKKLCLIPIFNWQIHKLCTGPCRKNSHCYTIPPHTLNLSLSVEYQFSWISLIVSIHEIKNSSIFVTIHILYILTDFSLGSTNLHIHKNAIFPQNMKIGFYEFEYIHSIWFLREDLKFQSIKKHKWP